jgi:hypothetical protein
MGCYEHGNLAVTTLILLTGVLFIVIVLVWFAVGERYRTLADDLGPAEREWVSREAADLLAELASRAISLAQMERVVEAELRDREDSVRVSVRRRLARAGSRESWSAFARGSALVEEDPVRAVRELPALRSAMEESLEAYHEVLVMLGVATSGTSVVEWGEEHERA